MPSPLTERNSILTELSLVEKFSDGYQVLEKFCKEMHASPEVVAAAKNVFCSWLYAISPSAFQEFVIGKGKIGDVYTPGIASAIKDFSVVEPFLPKVLRPHMIQYDKDLLEQAQTDREGAKQQIQKGIVDYSQALYNFFRNEGDEEWSPELFSQFVTVVTDGSRILGIKDQGAKGAYISAGKLRCYYLGSGGAILPQFSLPIGLDVGTDPKHYAPGMSYNGLRKNRVTGKDYFDFAKLTLEAIDDLGISLIQFEDFTGDVAWELIKWAEEKFEHASFNDDIQGTAAMVAEALLMAESQKIDLVNSLYFFDGAGGAASGIAEQVNWWIGKKVDEKVEKEEITADKGQTLKKKILERFFFTDSVGPLCQGRVVKAAQRTIKEALAAMEIKVDEKTDELILERFRNLRMDIDVEEIVNILNEMLKAQDIYVDQEQVAGIFQSHRDREFKKFQQDLGMVLGGERLERLQGYMRKNNIPNLAQVTLANLIDCFGNDLGKQGSIFLFGTSTSPGGFSQEVISKSREKVKEVAVEDPNRKVVVLAMSNPTEKTEILTAEESILYHNEKDAQIRTEILIGAVQRAYNAAEGQILIGTGSPFPESIDVGEGKTIEVAQANNIFIFPGVGLGVMLAGANKVTKNMWMAASQALFDWFKNEKSEEKRIANGALYPKGEKIQEISEAIAVAVAQAAIEDNEVDVDSIWNRAETATQEQLIERMQALREKGVPAPRPEWRDRARVLAQTYVALKTFSA